MHEHGMDVEEAPKVFSWKQGVMHAGALALVVIALGVAVVASNTVADPYRFGQGLGRFVGVVFGLGFGASWLYQTGRKRSAAAVGIAILALGIAVLVLVRKQVELGGPVPLKASDRAPLDETRDASGSLSTLRHPNLGFVLELPPGNRFAPMSTAAFTSAFDNPNEQHAYGYEEPDGTMLIVLLSRGRFGETEMRGFMEGFRSEAAAGNNRLVHESLDMDGDTGEALLEVDVSPGGAMKVRAVSTKLNGDSFLVVVMGITLNDAHTAGLDALLDALQL